jgi:glutamate 5-kinase
MFINSACPTAATACCSGIVVGRTDRFNLFSPTPIAPEETKIISMNIYNQRFSTYSQQMAQVLLTRDVIEYPESRNNVTNSLSPNLVK